MLDATSDYSPSSSPFLSSYEGLSGSEEIGLANLQSTYNQTPPDANFAKAEQLVQAASTAVDPNLQNSLLQKALALLTPNSAQGAGAAPNQSAASAGPSAAPTDATSDTSGVDASASKLSVSGNSVNTGEYTITGSTKDDGSLTITDNKTGQSTEVWGDPHVKVNGQDTAEFQKGPMNIQLQDGTTVHIDPTALNGNGVAHIGQVSITKGNDTVTMGGASSNGFEGSVNTSGVMKGISSYQSGLYNSPNAIDVTLGADGNLYHNNANGSMGQEITAKSGGGETDLDGSTGGLIGQPQAQQTGSSGENTQQMLQQLMSIASQQGDNFSANLMQTYVSQMMSQSGYPQA